MSEHITLEQEIKNTIREIPDYPKPGVNFKDFTPILHDIGLCRRIAEDFVQQYRDNPPDLVMGVESRGFLWGMLIAERLNVPFIPARKANKLPPETISEEFELEYGTAIVEIKTDSVRPGQAVMIHDDLLATGGTAVATAKLVERLGGKVHSFTMISELDFLKGRDKLAPYSTEVYSIVHY